MFNRRFALQIFFTNNSNTLSHFVFYYFKCGDQLSRESIYYSRNLVTSTFATAISIRVYKVGLNVVAIQLNSMSDISITRVPSKNEKTSSAANNITWMS